MFEVFHVAARSRLKKVSYIILEWGGLVFQGSFKARLAISHSMITLVRYSILTGFFINRYINTTG
jgi:hypothetical protein